ncbi:type II toxin-antitoxin system HicB family antitoxin [Dolichospermum planctonicum CS-1226]|jgi:predicted RNase H-like HicB family nuclease|uniref:Type II toxin-antitoxin system HicB family antitoxin n=1 Tax=Dolichospermum planctonicum CS-1226 TaxID=3021751 RepID=A0ABT5AHJ1_9CYAN|nr:type II toxin-antitoxin system HicB family antitoxin [Dolichospermum planctonicum]MDB9535971.1 type II toxin-antitoxin system HicB family antitoxin [Dolichospermum planctonicum CS-1226]
MKNSIPNHFTIEVEQEEDGRWIAEILEIPGVLSYGLTQQQAISNVQALALRVIADKLEQGEMNLGLKSLTFIAA